MRFPICIFDLYGTLVDIHTDENLPELWTAMANLYAAHGAVFAPEELQARYVQLVAEQEQGCPRLRQDAHEAHPEIQIETVFLALFREKGVEADMDLAIRTGRQFRAWSTEYIRLYDGARTLLQALKDQGCRVYLLSNAQHIFTQWELRQLDLEPYFDGIYLSSDYGCKKPDRRFFEILLQERSIDPKQAVMIGNDGVCDIQGARAVGLSTIYVRSNISPKEPLPEADDVVDPLDLGKVLNILTQDEAHSSASFEMP